ncbi:cytochrome c [Anaerobacillus alkaliphilus]|uniref:Cytochrome c n=1 Tax=Anaerobacillus alkaliphilus TaxID=1548597 RepID=A0A4V1LG45_9BACI|nr:cytochrome c [Anaerobacillus alkaliphilus]RXI98484.1 cytochrome c [Anaerobacillus alkaliphilus]
MDNNKGNDDRSHTSEEQHPKTEHGAPMDEPPTPQVEDMAEDIRMGNAKVPRFLVVTYCLLAIWAFGYLIMAVPLNQVAEVAADGETIFSQSCFGCHSVTDEYKIGPGMQGITERYNEEELQKILLNGIGTMPSLPSLGLNTEQIKAVKEYISTL